MGEKKGWPDSKYHNAVTTEIHVLEYMFLSNGQVIFTNIDHILDHKIGFNKFKRIQVIVSVFRPQ